MRSLPWVRSAPRGLLGHLFYYDAVPWGRRQLSGFRIYTGGTAPNRSVNMKILWSSPDGIGGARLDVRGREQATGARFHQALQVGPSIVDVPRAGCWRLTLTAKGRTSRLTVLAVPR